MLLILDKYKDAEAVHISAWAFRERCLWNIELGICNFIQYSLKKKKKKNSLLKINLISNIADFLLFLFVIFQFSSAFNCLESLFKKYLGLYANASSICLQSLLTYFSVIVHVILVVIELIAYITNKDPSLLTKGWTLVPIVSGKKLMLVHKQWAYVLLFPHHDGYLTKKE